MNELTNDITPLLLLNYLSVRWLGVSIDAPPASRSEFLERLKQKAAMEKDSHD